LDPNCAVRHRSAEIWTPVVKSGTGVVICDPKSWNQGLALDADHVLRAKLSKNPLVLSLAGAGVLIQTQVEILCGFYNGGDVPLNVTHVAGSINSPMDFRVYVQNWTSPVRALNVLKVVSYGRSDVVRPACNCVLPARHVPSAERLVRSYDRTSHVIYGTAYCQPVTCPMLKDLLGHTTERRTSYMELRTASPVRGLLKDMLGRSNAVRHRCNCVYCAVRSVGSYNPR
jgi:hypothetical protein